MYWYGLPLERSCSYPMQLATISSRSQGPRCSRLASLARTFSGQSAQIGILRLHAFLRQISGQRHAVSVRSHTDESSSARTVSRRTSSCVLHNLDGAFAHVRCHQGFLGSLTKPSDQWVRRLKVPSTCAVADAMPLPIGAHDHDQLGIRSCVYYLVLFGVSSLSFVRRRADGYSANDGFHKCSTRLAAMGAAS